MKNTFLLFGSLFFLLFLVGCGGDAEAGDNSDADNTSQPKSSLNKDSDKPSRENIAVSTWENHSLVNEPGGKWQASVAFGEELTLLGDTATAKNRVYEKVQLADGKTGWVRQDLIQKGAQLGALTETSSLYKRPGVSNITDEKIQEGTLVVIGEKQEQWTYIIGANDAKNHRAKGWLLGEDLISVNEIDVAVAVMMVKALNEKNPVKKRARLNDILANSSYSASPFYKRVEVLAAEADPMENLAEDELMITGNVVNVRSTPAINDENKAFTLESGAICKVIEKGTMEEIKGNTDYWYKIEAEGQSGWVFGSNTSRAIDQ